ncbi:NAD-dependent epimerase/dehydratase family protein [Spirochaeta cellobiosiphila]|uniref:NAD-dependent epimerase/dehydratase family protein n=1 Tax=Spirochaeta cellobiosiphila TaxID=504483 RepID=UPI00048E6368|nr:NAD(P)-dependent oxidoreductase [Spirochaeta cellobiosiphila]
MKVLVTGATGFLGSSLIKLLEEHNIIIHAFGRNSIKGNLLKSTLTQFYQGDLLDIEELRKAALGCTHVIHAAALSTLWGKWDDFYHCNVQGTQNILKICEELEIKRLIYISSPSIYCSPENQFDIPEERIITGKPFNYYIKSKRMAETLIKSQINPSFEWTIIRPRGLFGIGDTSLIPRLMEANDKQGIPLIRSGKNLMDITYVDNVSYSIYLALIKDNVNTQIFNITNGEPMTFKQMITMFMNKINKPVKFLKLPLPLFKLIVSAIEAWYKFFKIYEEPPVTLYTLITLGYSQTLDISKAEKILDYKPLISVEEGMDIYAKWYKEQDK